VRKLVWVALIVFGAAGIAVAGETSLKPQGAPLKITRARPVTSTAKDEITGSLFSSKLGALGFEVGGRLMKTRVQKGEVVKEGALLGQLDPEIVDAQVAGAEAAVVAAEAGAEMATDMAARNEKLKAEGSVSDVQSKGANTTSKQAQAQLLGAKAQLSQAKAARRRHDLKAPFAGTVIDAPDQIGGLVGPGMPVYIIQQLDPLILQTTITEDARELVKAGVKVKVSSVGGRATTNDAVVKVVLASADPQTRRVPIEILVPNSDGRFVANTLARAVLPMGSAQNAVAIPATALGTNGGEHVWAVGPDSQLKRVPVKVLERVGKEVILAPSEPVEQIIDYPTSALVEGTKVTASR
jgi:membrane fusion protein (multidrug efflux system)